ncbi:MAG TPA: contact-dependent growth inhibition system immunity protein [Vicinamibacterales bacterium]|nr:contact-dependent growth inhibition system immunity protein [Vicinamibacterales bacterium]
MNYSDKYPHLDVLLAGYFNQDWPDEASDDDEVVARFVAMEPEEIVLDAKRQLEQFLDSTSDEVLSPGFLLREFSCYYLPQGMTNREWLQRLLGLIETTSQNKS